MSKPKSRRGIRKTECAACQEIKRDHHDKDTHLTRLYPYMQHAYVAKASTLTYAEIYRQVREKSRASASLSGRAYRTEQSQSRALRRRITKRERAQAVRLKTDPETILQEWRAKHIGV